MPMNSIRINIFILITIGHNLKNHNNLYFYEIIVFWDVILCNVIEF